MDALTANLTVKLGGLATGITGNANLKSRLALGLATIALGSTSTGANKANQCLGPTSRSLAAGANETLDLTSYTSLLGETAKAISKCRLFVVYHDPASAASSITVGNAATPFPAELDTATTTRTLAPGEGFAVWSNTTAGMSVTAGMGVKVLNNDGANAATYTIAAVGEV